MKYHIATIHCFVYTIIITYVTQNNFHIIFVLRFFQPTPVVIGVVAVKGDNIKTLFNKAEVVYPGGAELEISHHYGVENFYETGITMITVVNREYCKKLIAVLPKQNHPEQFHKKKEETFHVLYGDVQLYLNGEHRELSAGDAITIQQEERHSFTTKTGCVIEEISSTHYKDDTYYTDEKIGQNKHRKTFLKYWL